MMVYDANATDRPSSLHNGLVYIVLAYLMTGSVSPEPSLDPSDQN